jgi:hypothetical protein
MMFTATFLCISEEQLYNGLIMKTDTCENPHGKPPVEVSYANTTAFLHRILKKLLLPVSSGFSFYSCHYYSFVEACSQLQHETEAKRMTTKNHDGKGESIKIC